MSKLHRDNAGYVGCSYEETQDPYFSYNKLSLPLSESDKTVLRDEVTLTVTVVNSKFVIDGTSQAALSLTEGVVYKFDQSAASNSGHPLRLSVTSDGTHSRGTEYYRGVRYVGTPGSSGAYTELTVPFAGIDLHYYCKVHPNMGSSAATPASSTMFTRALPIYDTSDAFGSSLGQTGSATGIQYGYDNSDNSLDTSSTSVSLDTTGYTFNTWSGSQLASGLGGIGGNSAQVWKASDGSVKTWFVSTDSTDRRLWTSNDGVNWSFRGYNYDTDGGTVAITARYLGMAGGSNSSTHTVTAAAAPVVKKDPYARNLVLALPLSVGGFDDVSSEIRGHGSAKAITSFSGSSTGGAEILTTQSKYYGRSYYAVRGGVNSNQSDYITRTGDADLAFGEGDFTVEFWFYPTTLVSNYVIFDNRHPTTGWPNSSNGFALIGNSSGTIHVYTGGGNLISADYAIQNQANQWHHIAVSRQDSFTSLYINGERKGDVVEDLNDYNEGRFTLGSSSPNGEGTTAYFNDLRIYKGVAKYKPEQSGHTGFQAVRYTGIGSAINRIGANVFSNYSAVVGGTVADADKAFNGSSANWANLTASSTSTAASVDLHFTYPIHGVTKIEAYFDSPSSSGDTRGRYNGANGGATRTGTGSGYSDIYSGSAITVTSVGFAINQNGSTGTNNDIVSRFRITDSSGTYILVNGQGQYIPFQPDLVWLKNDGSYTGHHVLYDSVRGTTKHIRTSDSAAEYDEDANRSLTKFNVDGFTLDTSGGEHVGPGNINLANDAYVAYCWKAGGAASSVSHGSLTSSVYDDSQTWSGQVHGNVYSATYAKTEAFSGTVINSATLPANAQTLTFTPSPAFSNAKTVRIYYYYPTTHADAWKINGTSVGDDVQQTSGRLVHTFDVSGSGFTSLAWSRQLHGSEDTGVFGIEVDGVLLVDNGVSLNSVPSHTSSLSASPETGFSIVKWTAPSSPTVSRIPHGLSTAPKLIFVKGLTGSVGITAGHDSAGWTKRLKLNDTIAATAGTGFFNDTPPASKYFTLGSNNVSNDFIAYCFSDVENYQKISSYIGGGSNTVTVTTGFRPQWLLIKADIAGEDWVIMDDARSKVMPATDAFFANTLGVQSNGAYNVYFLDDGFRVHNNNPRFNTQGETYFYMAIGGSKTTDPKDSVYEFVDQLNKVDLSGNSNNASSSGATWQTSIKKFYDGATYFNGSAVMDVEDSSDFAFGSGDFTIEYWVNTSVKTADGVYRRMFVLDGPTGDTGANLSLNIDASSGHVIAWGGNAGPGAIVNQGVNITDGAWHHVACVRQGTSVSIYVDGSIQGTGTDSRSLFASSTAQPRLGGASSTGGRLNGYMQDVRIYKGIAKYTSSFSPPERSVKGTARRYPSGVYVVS